MWRRLFVLLLTGLTLSACGPPGTQEQYQSAIDVPVLRDFRDFGVGPGGKRIAILAPLSGPYAVVGPALVQAARLALDTEGAPSLDQQDTTGTPEGAARAARTAIAAGAGIILGPLTSAETAAVAPIAHAAGVPVLAFTNDVTQAELGVWTFGITPEQQVQRLAKALQDQGKERLAGLLPDNGFGHAMSAGLIRTAATLGLPDPRIRTYPVGAGIGALNGLVRDISEYVSRRGPIEAEARAARATGTAMARRRSERISRRAVPAAPFDALLLAGTEDVLEVIASLLPYYDLDGPAVRVLGPSLWVATSTGAHRFQGAWYAAPDPANRAAFEQAFAARTGFSPPAIADIAFDAAAIARVTASSGFSVAALTRGDGFMGTNGLLVLRPDGQMRRGLAIFQIQRGGPQMVEPAPQSLIASGT